MNNVIVVSDLHCGDQMGLCPPDFILDDGGLYTLNPVQYEIWGCWIDFWHKWVPSVTKGENFVVVCNGDAIDGDHHNAVCQITHNMADQIRIAKLCMAVPLSMKKCKGYYHIRGTEAHVGQSGQYEEILARELAAFPDGSGRHARWELLITIGKRDLGLVHITHHIGTSGSLAYETSALHKELEQNLVEAARWGHRHADVIVRSHRHRNCETRIQTGNGFATSCTTAGWQAKTPFVYKIPGGRQSLPQIGGTLVRAGDVDVFTRHRLWNLKGTPQERAGRKR